MKCVLFVTMENQYPSVIYLFTSVYILGSVAYSLPLFGLFSPLHPSFLPLFYPKKSINPLIHLFPFCSFPAS